VGILLPQGRGAVTARYQVAFNTYLKATWYARRDGAPGAKAPVSPGKTTLLPGRQAIKARDGFERYMV
jgi:hypothetical protein